MSSRPILSKRIVSRLACAVVVLGFGASAAGVAEPSSASRPQGAGDVDSTTHPTVRRAAPPRGSSAPPRPTRFTPAQVARLEAALVIARRVARDTLFGAVLRRLAANGEIDWGNSRLRAIPRAQRGRAVAFLLDAFADRGLWAVSDLRAYDFPDESRTTSAVVACADTARINIDKLARTAREIAGTMIHERAHAFCQRHRFNDRARDRCDFAYVAGDLTIVIDHFRANGSRPVLASSRWCPALRRRLQEFDITH